VPPTGLELRVLAGDDLEMRARRFAATFGYTPLTTPAQSRTVTIRPTHDGAAARWRLLIVRFHTLEVCRLSDT
jgi:hypothetical protein